MADAEERLQGLRLRNLFLIPLDRSGTWVRFHHLVGEFFRERYRAHRARASQGMASTWRSLAARQRLR